MFAANEFLTFYHHFCDIYEINAGIVMILTSPFTVTMSEEIKTKVSAMWSVKSAEVNLVWKLTRAKEMMSAEALLELGFM